MGRVFGRGWGKDVGKMALDSLLTASGIRHVTGQQIYDPEYEGIAAQKFGQFTEATDQLGAAVGPMILDYYIPGAGAALKGVRNALPEMGAQYDSDGPNDGFGGAKKSSQQLFSGWEDENKFVQDPGNNSKMAPAQSNLTNTPMNPNVINNPLYAFGGHLPMPGVEGAGPNLYEFDGPEHAQGGMNFNGNAEIEKQETIDPKAKYVYSDRLKVPGTDQTFAEASKKWKGSDRDDDITKKTNQLMLDRLRNNQEELKKQDFEKAAKKFQKKYGGYIQEQMAKGGYYTPAEAQAAHPKGKWVNIGTQYGSGGPDYGGPIQYDLGGFLSGLGNFTGVYNSGPAGPNQNYGVDITGTGWEDQYLTNQQAYMDWQDAGSPGQGWDTKGIQKGLANIGQFANIGYNMKMANAPIDYYKAIQNPEYDKSIALMTDRRYNAEPELAEARRTFGQTKQAVQDMAGGSSAAALANIHGAQITADRAKQAVLAKKQNMDNDYALQEAQFRGNMGALKADELRRTQLYKLQAEAARRKFGAQAANDTSKLSQIKLQEAGQKSTDDALLGLLKGQYGDLGNLAELLGAFV